MKRELREELKRAQIRSEQSNFELFVEDYLTPKNILIGAGIASLAGVATYSTVRVMKDKRILNKIKKELKFSYIKKVLDRKLNLSL